MEKARAEKLVDTVHIRMIDPVRSIGDDDFHGHTSATDLTKSADNRRISNISMLDEDRFSRS